MPPSTARSTPVTYELSSEARNATAAAISSGMPLRPIGVCVVNCATACSACSAVRPVVVAKAGVSIAPGLTQFTRILRSFNSKAQPRAKLRTAVFEEVKGLLHRKEHSLHVHVEGLVKMGLSSYRERCDCPCARVREKNVDVTMFFFHDGIEPVQIFQARDVAHDRRNLSLDEGCGLLQLFLSTP